MDDYSPQPPQLDITDAQLELDLLVLREKVETAEHAIRALIPARDASHEDFMFHLEEGSNAWGLGNRSLWSKHKARRDIITARDRKPLEQAKEALADILVELNPLEDERLRREGKFFVFESPTLGNAYRTVSAEVHSQAWYDQRAKGIGGSDIAAILNVSPWTTRDELLDLKTGITQPAPPRTTGALRRGGIQEDAIARCYAAAHESEAIFVHCKDSWTSSTKSYQNANIDGLAYLPGGEFPRKIVEIKTSSTPQSWLDGVPYYYRLQALWYMDAFGIEEADFAVLVDDVNYREFAIRPEPGEMDEIHRQVAEFVAEIRDVKRHVLSS